MMFPADMNFNDEFLVKQPTSRVTSPPKAVALGGDRMVTVWDSPVTGDVTPARVYAQIHNDQGEMLGGPIEIAAARGTSIMRPVVTALDTNSYVVAYNITNDLGRPSIGYRIVKDGVVGPERFVSSSSSSVSAGFDITTLSNGDFVIGWVESGQIVTQTFAGNNADSPVGQAITPMSAVGNPRAAINISLTSLQDGHFAVAYMDTADRNVYLAYENHLPWMPGPSSPYFTGQYGSGPITNHPGIVWVSEYNATYALGNGTSRPDAATLSDGTVIVAWDSWGDIAATGAGTEIVFRFVSIGPDGYSGISDWYFASARSPGNQTAPNVVALRDGGFVVAWENGSTGEAAEVMGRRFDSYGSAYDGEIFQINQSSAGQQRSPVLVAFDNNAFGAIWVDTAVSTANSGIEGRIEASVGKPDLSDESDSGVDNQDNITSSHLLKFTGVLSPRIGVERATVFIDMNHNGAYDHEVDVSGTTLLSDFNYTVEMLAPQQVKDSYKVYAFTTDYEGRNSALSTPLELSIDTLAPTGGGGEPSTPTPTPPAIPAVLDLSDQSDTGELHDDGVTAANSLTVSGSSADQDGAQVTAFIDVDGNGRFDAQVDRAANATVQGGAWVAAGLDTTGLNGAYDIRAVNPADPTGTTGAALQVTIDHSGPATTVPGLALSADTGSSNADFITRTAQQTISATLSAPLAAGEKLMASLDGGDNWTDISASVQGTAVSAALGLLPAGGSLVLRVEDEHGNAGAEITRSYTLDTAAPGATASASDLKSPAANTFSVVVNYLDGAIDAATIGAQNIAVTGPSGVSLAVLGYSTAAATTGPSVTYTVQAPSGDWNRSEAGTYTIGVGAQPVRDIAGNALPPASLGSFDVSFNLIPEFIGSVADFKVVQNAGATDIAQLLHVADGDLGQTIVWSAALQPQHGTLSFPAGVASGAGDIAPGSVLYTPAPGFTGVDSFQVKVSDGVDVSYRSILVNVSPAALTGKVSILGTAKQGETLSASNDLLDANGAQPANLSYQWKAGDADILGATGSTLVLGQEHVGKPITVVARYTNGQGALDSTASAASAVVENVNDLPTGGVGITGIAKQGETLSASNDLGDLDGINPATVGYQWKAGDADILGATGSSLVLVQEHVGKAISVVATYTDGQGTVESKASAATAVVANVNDLPTGSVRILGTAKQGETLTAGNDLGDLDGFDPASLSYQWKAGDADILGATGSTLVLGQEHVGKTITVIAKYTDAQGTVESKASVPSAAVANANDLPTGSVSISGTASEGETLSASNSLADADGFDAAGLSYQWQAGGVDIAGATGSSLVLTAAQIGKAITVVANYTDAYGTHESASSAATAVVTNINAAPTGKVSILGTAKQGETLSASNDLDDLDGFDPATVSYQWKAGDADIAGATGSTLVLGQQQVGKAISVVAKYTDGQGTVESTASAATAMVANVNDLPTGSVRILGTAKQGETLTAGNDLGDLDGFNPASLSYQWKAGDADILGATGSTLVLGQEQVGKPITVLVKYTDGQGALESTASAATAAVANVNDLPTGSVSITGTASEGETLSASNSLADADGFDAAGVRYQWQADGVDIAGATGSTLALGQELVGKLITVLASYTDGQGSAESKASAASAAVAIRPAAPSTPPVDSATIDGVTVENSQTTNPDGTTTQVLTIPVVTAGRGEEIGNNTVADIPLVRNANGAVLLTAQVPTGLGLSMTGSGEAKSAGNSLTDLIREIKAHTAAGSLDQNQLTGGGSGFLSDLPSSTSLLVQTIVPTAAINAVPGSEALVINGTPAAAGTPMTALVIDAQALAAGTNIQLNNVEFAAVIGSVRVTGGDGSQNVWGDGAAQYIMLGADDDILHGGAGNDTVGSAGGNDRVYGDEGDDLVFGGAGNDYVDGGTGTDIALMTGSGRADYSFRVVGGNLTVTHLGGADGTDILANVETLRFASAGSDTGIHGSINRLVEAVNGKTADFSTTERWVDAYSKGMQVGAIAQAMLASNTTQQALGDEAFVQDLYANVLHRKADAAGAAMWKEALATGTLSRADVALSIANSSEKLALAQPLDIDVNQTDIATLVRMYSTIFDRAADEAGLNYWIAQYEGGAGLSGIADGFIASVETIGRYDVASNADFVNALYKTAFHRDADASEINFWLDGLDSGAIDRGDVLLGFADSAEKIGLVGVIGTSIDTL